MQKDKQQNRFNDDKTIYFKSTEIEDDRSDHLSNKIIFGKG